MKIVKVATDGKACGIAIYNEHDMNEISNDPRIEWVKVAAIDNIQDRKRDIYHNPENLFTVIEQENLDSWYLAGKKAGSEADVVMLEREHGINRNPELDGFYVFTEGVKKGNAKIVDNSHTWEYNPETLRKKDSASVIQNSDLVFILNRITLDAIVKREHYGPMPLEKFHYFPHPVRNNLNGSEDNRNRIAEMFGIETDPNKEGYRVISASVGLISPEKGLDKLIDSIVMAQNNRNLLPTKFKDTGLHFVVGSGHPNHKLRLAEGNPERTDDAWREWLFNTLGKKLNDGTIPWLYCPGQKEAIEADLSKYSFVFIDHFMAEHEFRNWLVLPHIGIITNQDSQQTSSGPIAEYGTLRTLLATHSLASEQQLLPIPYRIGEEIGAEERDSGWLIELGKNYTKYLAQAYGRAVANTDLRNWKEARAIDKREEQTYKTLTKTKIDLIESLL